MKTVLFVPGFREGMKSRNYKSVLEAIKSQGYAVEFVPISWKRTAINDWVEQLEKEYARHDPKDTVLAGFSYGSLTVFMAAAKQLPAEPWLFSLSPYFSDDIPKLKQSWLNSIGKKRIATFEQLNFDALAKTIRCKTLIFVGALEAKKYPLLGRRARLAKESLVNSQFITVSAVGHDIGHPNYVEAIKSAISRR
jgi:predicted alpha/beta hydrolase family esterase